MSSHQRIEQIAGSRLLEENAANTLMEKLFPLADIITPNIPELEVISGRQIESTDDIIEASKAIYDKYGCPVLSKGGHFTDTACVCDYLWDGKRVITFETKRVDNPNSHGTGCTLSSAIASGLAKGQSLEQEVVICVLSCACLMPAAIWHVAADSTVVK